MASWAMPVIESTEIVLPDSAVSLQQFQACPFQCKIIGNRGRAFDGYKYVPGSEWQCVNSCQSCRRGNWGAVCRNSP